MSDNTVSRRAFLAGATAAAALTQGCETFDIIPRHVLGGSPKYVPPSEKLRIASIGCGGKGESDIEAVAGETLVAFCDVDDDRASATYKKFPNVRRYHDYREMLEKEKEIDAVTVSTPDHTHAPAALMAMERGLHVFCQKPLTHDVAEARMLRDAARKNKVVTQMGNQGSAEDGLRTAVEIVQSGGIGQVHEVHVWTNRPIWPQGKSLNKVLPAMTPPPAMHWDLWLGSAPERPYNKGYAPFAWRGWWDFGTGALGDMACHTANMPFMALSLAHPTHIEAEGDGLNDQTYPNWSIIKFSFPKRKGPGGRDLDPLTFTWYDGGKMPPKELSEGKAFSKSGCLLIGDKGKLFSPNDYGANFHLLPEKDFKDFQNPAPTLPRVHGEHHKEWVQACKGQGTTFSNFEYASLLTETILLGNIAVRLKKPIEWDGEKMRATNAPEADSLIKRHYREYKREPEAAPVV